MDFGWPGSGIIIEFEEMEEAEAFAAAVKRCFDP
jgi:hypothetical protein